MVNGKEHAFVRRSGRNGIGTSVGTFFSNFLMAAADMPARRTKVGGTAAAALWITRIIATLVPTLSFKVVAGDASDRPAPRASCDKRVVIDRKKTIALPVGAPGFWLRGNAASVLTIVVGEAGGTIWIDVDKWAS